MKLEPGATYETNARHRPSTIVFVVLAECETKRVRFNKREPGYRILVLDSDAPFVYAGNVYEWVKKANIFVGLRRLA